jgi:Co/Zn/Cd efflux system component
MMNTDNIVIDSKIMLITSFVSLACNIFNLIVLGEDHDDPLGGADSSDEDNGKEENINVKAAIIHAIGDLLQSVGVIVAAIIITIWP